MSKLQYHQAIFDLLDLQAVISQSQVSLINQREQLCQVAFPASVREWFSIEGAADLFFNNSNNDHLEPVEELGNPTEIEQGYLRIAIENQGVFAWYVPLDGSDDPPVFQEAWKQVLSPNNLQLAFEKVSIFIFIMMTINCFDSFSNDLYLEATDREPTTAQLEELRACYQEGPQTNYYGSSVINIPTQKIYNFFNKHGLIQINEYIERVEADWMLRAKSTDSFCELLDSVWHYHSLAEKFTDQLSCKIGELVE